MEVISTIHSKYVWGLINGYECDMEVNVLFATEFSRFGDKVSKNTENKRNAKHDACVESHHRLLEIAICSICFWHEFYYIIIIIIISSSSSITNITILLLWLCFYLCLSVSRISQ